MIETFDAIFDGLMLGDGNLRKPYKNALYQHSCKNISYLYYLKSIMEDFGLSFSDKCPYTYTHKRAAANIYSILASRRNTYLTEKYYVWYPENKKTVPVDLELTPDACRHWYCGDGYLGSSHGFINHIVLYTNGFSDRDREILQEKLLGKGWKSSVMCSGQLYIGKEYFLDFLSYIGECPSACYQYKWTTNSREEYDKMKLACEGL